MSIWQALLLAFAPAAVAARPVTSDVEVTRLKEETVRLKEELAETKRRLALVEGLYRDQLYERLGVGLRNCAPGRAQALAAYQQLAQAQYQHMMQELYGLRDLKSEGAHG